jgi:hypothetical protein
MTHWMAAAAAKWRRAQIRARRARIWVGQADTFLKKKINRILQGGHLTNRLQKKTVFPRSRGAFDQRFEKLENQHGLVCGKLALKICYKKLDL